MGKKSKIKLETGTIYQKEENGTYYYRYQVKGERKCVSLKTANQEEALKEAKKYLLIHPFFMNFSTQNQLYSFFSYPKIRMKRDSGSIRNLRLK